MRLPTSTSAGKSRYVVLTRSLVPATCSVVKMNRAPRSSRTEGAPSASGPVRTFGPGRSCSTAVWIPSSAEICASGANHRGVLFGRAVREIQPQHVSAAKEERTQHRPDRAMPGRRSRRSSYVCAKSVPSKSQPCAPEPAGSCGCVSAVKAGEIPARSAGPALSGAISGKLPRSLLLHALLAALLFTVLVSSSQQGATENVQAAKSITIERTSPVVVPNQPAATRAVAPVPHVPRIAPVHHAPLDGSRRRSACRVNRHELAKSRRPRRRIRGRFRNSTPQPNPQPTQNIFETHPQSRSCPAPGQHPDGRPIAVALKAPPTRRARRRRLRRRPSPRPPLTAAPTAQRPRPGAKPATARSPRCHKPAPTAASDRAAPRASLPSAPACRARARPARPWSRGRPGRRRSPRQAAVPRPGRVPATARSERRAAAPDCHSADTIARAQPTRAPRTQSAPNINAKLRALLPNNPVNPQSKQYTPSYSLRGRLEPTPPPEVLAQTKYIYEVTRHRKRGSREDVGDCRAQGGPDDDLHRLARALSASRGGGYAVAAGPTRRSCTAAYPAARQTARRSRSAAAAVPRRRSVRSMRASRRSSTEWSRSRATDGCWCRTHSRQPRRRNEAAFPLAFRHKSH